MIVDIFCGDNAPDKAILLLSGGLDSASLLYLLCKYYPNTTIIPATGDVAQHAADIYHARNIVFEMRKRFSNIGDHYEHKIDLDDEEWLKKSVDLFDKIDHKISSLKLFSKHLQQIEALKNIRQKTGACVFINGTTANPPEKEIDFSDIAEEKRSPNVIHDKVIETPYGGKIYSPYINEDKKFVANIYKEEELDWLYPLTRSCVATAEQTNNFETVCGECYWCKEKAWAFDYI